MRTTTNVHFNTPNNAGRVETSRMQSGRLAPGDTICVQLYSDDMSSLADLTLFLDSETRDELLIKLMITRLDEIIAGTKKLVTE